MICRILLIIIGTEYLYEQTELFDYCSILFDEGLSLS